MRKLFVAMIAAAGFAAVAAHAQVGVSIGINEPGVYGQINIGGGYPPPVLVSPQPVIALPVRGVALPPPIYMYVPPAYEEHWGRYCARYNACHRPVYFVQEQWVRDRYQHYHPEWRGDHDREWHGDRDHGWHGDRDNRHPPRRDDRHTPAPSY